MEETLIIENWEDIKTHREAKGLTLSSLAEKMRLPVERIEYLEVGDFSDADPVITRLQLKNYCLHLGLDYEKIAEMSGLNTPKTEIQTSPLGTQVKSIKTRSYKGRKKEPSKALIYTVIVVGVVGAIFILNLIARNLNISSDVFEMTEQQKTSLDAPISNADSASFRPVLPQSNKEEIVQDVIEGMNIYQTLKITFPLKIDIFPKETLSYRYETDGQNPKEDFIMKNTPKSLFFSRPGRMIFYHTSGSRFVVSGFAFRESDINQVVFVVTEDRELIIYTK